MLESKIQAIKDLFDVEFIDYGKGDSILITSGAGIGMALMDVLLNVRYLLDIDSYRFNFIDWESIGAILSAAKPKKIIFAGWFSLDKFDNINKIAESIIDIPCYSYTGGIDDLNEFITRVNSDQRVLTPLEWEKVLAS